MAVDICFVLSHGMSARMVLHSDLVPELCALGLSVAVVSPNADEPGFSRLARRKRARAVKAPPVPRRLRLLADLRPYLVEDVRRAIPLWARHQRSAAQASSWRRMVRVHGSYGLNRMVRKIPALPGLVARIDVGLLRSQAACDVIEDVAPRMLVSTYPVAALEGSMLLAAKRAGVRTAIELLSWDNITCKGKLALLADRYVTWGPIMSEELAEHYGVTTSVIEEAGVPHFDAHIRGPSAEGRAAQLDKLGLSPDAPYLFFGMSSPIFAPTEIAIVEWLAERLRAGVFGADMQLLVRPHPQNVRGHMADLSWLPRLEALRGDRVGVDFPELVEDSTLLWDMQESDLNKLANLLSGARVCLNSGSTLSIDAIVHDLPVVLTLFDTKEHLPWWRSASRLRDYPHLTKLIGLGGVSVCDSLASTEQAIAAYLRDPQRDAAGRERTRQRQVGSCDGRAAHRVAQALAQVLN